jgi:hypothetical protein
MRRSIVLIAVAVIIVSSAAVWWITSSSPQHIAIARPRERERLNADVATLTAEARSPLPRTAARDDAVTIAHGAATNSLSPRLQRLLSGDPLRGKISRDVLNAFLEDRGRTALSLLVAWQESGNEELLQEAAERHPDDPNVQLAMLATQLPDEERWQWIARFKASAPENALANYYAAAEFLQKNDLASAIAELRAATTKSGYEDYMIAQLAERNVLFQATGLPETEARVQAMFGVTMPFLSVLNKMRQGLPSEIEARLAGGDVQGAIDLGGMGMTMAAQMRTGSSSHVILNELVSLAIERSMLEALGTDAAGTLLGASSTDRLAEIKSRGEEIRELTRTIDPAANDISPAQLTQYLQIMLDSGELQALQWLKAQKR